MMYKYVNMFICLYVYMFESRYQLVYWHVMGDASDINGYDRRRLELSNALLRMK